MVQPGDNPAQQSRSSRSDVDAALHILRRRWRLIVGAAAIVFVVAVAVSFLQSKKYTAAASLNFNNNELTEQLAGLQGVSEADPQTQDDTNVQLVSLGSTASRTAAKVGHGLTSDDVRAMVSIAAVGDTSIVRVAATSTSPQLAADVANTYSKTFIELNADANTAYYKNALNVIQRQLSRMSATERAGSTGVSLETREQSLNLLASAQSGSVQVAESATVPTSASSPKLSRNAAVGPCGRLASGTVAGCNARAL